MFAYIRQQWRRSGLYCSSKPFVINDVIPKVEQQGQAVWAELDAEDQTLLVNIRRSPGRFEVPPPLPVMDEPAMYVLHPDVMQINTRKNYVRDRMRAALIYISEYEETKRMMIEERYSNDDLLVRLRAVFGRVDQVRHHIDVALQQDDVHRRKRNMRFLMFPTRFPKPESMSQVDITVWTNWIREETDEIMKQLEEERDSRTDPDDRLTVQQMVFSNPYKIRYCCHLQYRHQKDKEITAKIQNIFKICEKTLENRIQRREKREEMRRSRLHKENPRVSRTFSRIPGSDGKYPQLTHTTETKST